MGRPKDQLPPQGGYEPPRHEATIPRIPTFTIQKAEILRFLEAAGESLDVAVTVFARGGEVYGTGDAARIVPTDSVYLSIETSIGYEATHRGLHDFYDLAEALMQKASRDPK